VSATSLEAFIRQSNAIEGILRGPTEAEIHAHERLLEAPEMTQLDLEAFVARVANARIRAFAGMDVRVGNHMPPPGGSEVLYALNALLTKINAHEIDAWTAHIEYERLHPFMDGNGRSGRALWLWMVGPSAASLPLGFLHRFYYQTLSHVASSRGET